MDTQPQPETSAGTEPWERKHRLARALEHAGWKYQDMREYLAVSDTTMTNYMNGKTKRIPLSTIKAWAAATGTRWEWLQTGEGPWLRDGKGDGTPSDLRLDDWAWNLRHANVPATVHVLPIAN